MKNELALSGENITQKIYADIFCNVGMIRGEYLIRELNKNILYNETQNFINNYLTNICNVYHDEYVWYRFSELTNTESNYLEGTKEILDDKHPLFGLRGARRLLAYTDEFAAELSVIEKVYEKNKNLSIFIPFINDSKQLTKIINTIKKSSFKGKMGCMIELPSAYFDLDNILDTGINRITIGMNDLTSFIFATVRNSEWHDMNSDIMMNIIRDISNKAKNKNVEMVVAGYLEKPFINKLNAMGIKCVVHYHSIPDIFGRDIEFPNHLQEIKKKN
ncbi:putative PEP-binding protein [Oceanivirga salmonicida]|uniref:putative PEP-binding protein n=1 Tax=Oceanivirga salmonicida TaxID=1769291 RepID=UPI0012E1BE45|nr:putative PEP-binding protein [Oceanivirga salmonicida]